MVRQRSELGVGGQCPGIWSNTSALPVSEPGASCRFSQPGGMRHEDKRRVELTGCLCKFLSMGRIWKQLIFCSLYCLLVCIFSVDAQERTITTTINEPATIKVEAWLKQADMVAVMRILSGDTEHYSTAIYKAEVLQSFKGVEKGATVYFGPFISYGLGSEYLVFLHRSEKGIEPTEKLSASGVNYGPVSSFYLVMYEGYSAMPIEYDCVFDGRGIAQQYDYGIKVNTHQVVLPKNMKTFSASTRGSFSEDTKWVRRTVFIAYLQKLTG